jgi:DNA-binding NtrC family response regulator
MDLFYRLNVNLITVPPLRDRQEDIPLLARFFADGFSRSHARRMPDISPQTMAVLKHYHWPGNVRELMNVIERAVITSQSPELWLAEPLTNIQAEVAQNGTFFEAETSEMKGLSEVEREYILRALQKTGWRIEGSGGAARILGMNPSTMRARMKKLDIRRPRPS